MTKNEIVLFENQGVKLEVNLHDETVWLTQEQMIELFQRDQSVISRHIRNIFKEGELEKSNMQKMHIANSDKPVIVYNLDMIISVGYRVHSPNGIIFRKWATSIIKDYMIKGYAINQKRLDILEKSVQIVNIANRMNNSLEDSDAKGVLKVIGQYTKALDLLDDYDHKAIRKTQGTKDERMISYDECKNIIQELKYNENSKLFAIERQGGLEAIIGDVYQSFDGKDLYNSIQEKAANFLYMIVKNHPFTDGNKRIAATLFIFFLNYYDLLYKNGVQIIDNNTLVTLTLLIAESNPKEKDMLVDIVMYFLES